MLHDITYCFSNVSESACKTILRENAPRAIPGVVRKSLSHFVPYFIISQKRLIVSIKSLHCYELTRKCSRLFLCTSFTIDLWCVRTLWICTDVEIVRAFHMVEIQMLQNVKIYIDLAQISTIDNTNENASPFSYFFSLIWWKYFP